MTDRYLKEFEAKGEETVRRELALGIYGDIRGRHARHWLSELDRSSSEARNAEQAALARDAVDAAREANKIAKQARLIGITAVIASIVITLFS